MFDTKQYIDLLFKDFVMPGMLGGFVVSFSIYLFSLGVSFAYKLISGESS
ncbi:hypothetical protein [Paraclostridium benzoelyticum]|nr:hypothetical protein [Paraclostridium benzoelyticum]